MQEIITEQPIPFVQPESPYLLQMQGISKAFPGVIALHNVDFDLHPGEVHGLIGENGAGKSTLMKILSGVYQKDTGTIIYKGNNIAYQNTTEAQRAGISSIYQELTLIPNMTVTENIFLGHEIEMGGTPVLNWSQMRSEAQDILEKLHMQISPSVKVKTLGVAKRQFVEIAKALHRRADLIIMDEPTAVLSDVEIQELFNLIRQLKSQGVGIIYISHHLEEVTYICDRVTILRDSEKVGTYALSDITVDDMIRMMVGRSLSDKFPKANVERGREVLRVEGLTRKGVLQDISFTAYTGEILGIAGLVGSGRTELVRAIFGADKIDDGTIYLDGQAVDIYSPFQAVEHGIGLLTEDRKEQGLVLGMPVSSNVVMAILNRITSLPFLRKKDEEQIAMQFVNDLNIRTPNLREKVLNLSGGNQQKVVLSKWMATQPRVLIFDEPTRGIDVGAKVEIYNLMNKLITDGVAVIMISSELPEIIGMSDRVLVMYSGKLAGIMEHEQISQETIMSLATGNR